MHLFNVCQLIRRKVIRLRYCYCSSLIFKYFAYGSRSKHRCETTRSPLLITYSQFLHIRHRVPCDKKISGFFKLCFVNITRYTFTYNQYARRVYTSANRNHTFFRRMDIYWNDSRQGRITGEQAGAISSLYLR